MYARNYQQLLHQTSAHMPLAGLLKDLYWGDFKLPKAIPSDPAGFVSEGGEYKAHIEGSLMIPQTGYLKGIIMKLL